MFGTPASANSRLNRVTNVRAATVRPSPRSITASSSCQSGPRRKRRSPCAVLCALSAATVSAPNVIVRRPCRLFGSPKARLPSASRVRVRRTTRTPLAKSTSCQRSPINSPCRICACKARSQRVAKSSSATVSSNTPASPAVHVLTVGRVARGCFAASATLVRTRSQLHCTVKGRDAARREPAGQ